MKRFLGILLTLALALGAVAQAAPAGGAKAPATSSPGYSTSVPPAGATPQVPEHDQIDRAAAAGDSPGGTGAVIRVYQDTEPWWGSEGRVPATLLLLGKVRGHDYFVHPTSELANGIPAETGVVLITSNSWGFDSTYENVNSEQAQAALDHFVRSGGVLVVDMGDNSEEKGFVAPGSVGDAFYNLPDSKVCRDATLTAAALGPDGVLGTDDDHPMVKGPDGLAGTADDLDDLNIDIPPNNGCSVAHGHLDAMPGYAHEGITLPPNAVRLMTAIFYNVPRTILAEYALGEGLVILDTNTKESYQQYPAGYDTAPRFMTNLLAYALGRAEAVEPPTCILPQPEPLPELPTNDIAPLMDLPDDQFFQRLHEYALKARPSGSEDDTDLPIEICTDDPNLVFRFNGEPHMLPAGFPLIERDGKVFFPAERHTLKELGIDGWIGRSNMFGDGEEVLYLGNHEHVIATIPATGYTLWDLQLNPDGLESFLTDDEQYYYFDLFAVVEMLGGWVADWSQSTDGFVHIGIPQDPGSWLKSCELQGYRGSTLADCPNTQWVVGSTWEYYYNEPGHEPDAYSSILMVQGTIWKFGLGTGKDPAKSWTLQNVHIAHTLNSVGYGYEYAQRGALGTYGEYWLPMGDFLLETSLMAFDVVLQTYGSKWFSQWRQDPAKTVRLAEEARVIAKEEEYLLGARANEIRAHVLEQGLNIVEEGGMFKALPVTVQGEKTVAGRQARVIGLNPLAGKGGWFNQAKITGQPDPAFFTLDGKNYVLSFEYAAEVGGRALDGIGRPVLPGYPATVAFVEVKAGYKKYINPVTGDFLEEFQAHDLRRMIETFHQDILQAEALGLEAWQVFTQQDVATLFLKHAEEQLGKVFMEKHRHRVVVTTQKFIQPLTSDEPIKPGPVPPCPPEACPDSTKEVGK